MNGKTAERVPAFMNRVNPDLLLRAIERVQAMRLERLTGQRYEVRVRLGPKEEASAQPDAAGVAMD